MSAPVVLTDRTFEPKDRIVFVPFNFVVKKERRKLMEYLVNDAKICEVISCYEGSEDHNPLGEPMFSKMIRYVDEDGMEHIYDDFSSVFIPYDYDSLVNLLKLYNGEIKGKISELQDLSRSYNKLLDELYGKFFDKYIEVKRG